PPESLRRQLSMWCTVTLVSAVVLAIVAPPPDLETILDIIRSRQRQSTEPSRRRRLQMTQCPTLS
ncbi:hypothetical protein, partial [Rhodoplanes elegans]|uniref:hypothetical protein n=1 Tax=Rhodoplanes elegans TaxID=29408 RepID=UPI001AECB9D2